MIENKCNIKESRININNDRDYKIIYESDMEDEGYFNVLTEKQLMRIKENS